MFTLFARRPAVIGLVRVATQTTSIRSLVSSMPYLALDHPLVHAQRMQYRVLERTKELLAKKQNYSSKDLTAALETGIQYAVEHSKNKEFLNPMETLRLNEKIKTMDCLYEAGAKVNNNVIAAIAKNPHQQIKKAMMTYVAETVIEIIKGPISDSVEKLFKDILNSSLIPARDTPLRNGDTFEEALGKIELNASEIQYNMIELCRNCFNHDFLSKRYSNPR